MNKDQCLVYNDIYINTVLPVPQSVPEYPAAHAQVYPFTASVHTPLFKHGLLAHSSMSEIETRNHMMCKLATPMAAMMFACVAALALPEAQGYSQCGRQRPWFVAVVVLVARGECSHRLCRRAHWWRGCVHAVGT